MILSIDAEKAFDKVQHPFLIKTLSQCRDRGNILQYHKSHSEYHSQWEKTEGFSPKAKTKARMSTPPTFIQHSTGSSSHSSHTQKNKRHPHQ